MHGFWARRLPSEHTRARATAVGRGRSPSVRRARPPVGWHSTAEHEPQTTTDCEWLKTVVMLKQPWESERGAVQHAYTHHQSGM